LPDQPFSLKRKGKKKKKKRRKKATRQFWFFFWRRKRKLTERETRILHPRRRGGGWKKKDWVCLCLLLIFRTFSSFTVGPLGLVLLVSKALVIVTLQLEQLLEMRLRRGGICWINQSRKRGIEAANLAVVDSLHRRKAAQAQNFVAVRAAEAVLVKDKLIS